MVLWKCEEEGGGGGEREGGEGGGEGEEPEPHVNLSSTVFYGAARYCVFHTYHKDRGFALSVLYPHQTSGFVEFFS